MEFCARALSMQEGLGSNPSNSLPQAQIKLYQIVLHKVSILEFKNIPKVTYVPGKTFSATFGVVIPLSAS